MFWVYAIYSEKFNKIYIGHTNNIVRRLGEHNGLTAFRYWTTRHKPWVLFYSKSFETRALAMAEERHLKSGRGRRMLKELLKQGVESAIGG
jgi:putative endonuclease